MVVLTSANDSLGDGHILDLLQCLWSFGLVVAGDIMEWQRNIVFAFGKAREFLQDHIVDVQSVAG